MTIGLVEHPFFLRHSNGRGHPERPERLTAIADAARVLRSSGDIVALSSRDASRPELELVHSPAYLDQLEATRTRELTIFDADTCANEWSFAAAIRAAGSAEAAVHEALHGTIRRSFVAARPPGHHAETGRAMGFCLLNNAAVAAAAAIAHEGLDRVAIVDWDVHHGNGTAAMFADRRDILYVSLHQFPLYPGTGALRDVGSGNGEGFTVNVPLPAGCTDGDYVAAMDLIVAPVLRQYAPQLIVVSAGFDPHRNDPLAGMLLTAAGFAAMTRTLVDLADEFASGRIVHLLEGGYDLDGLAEGAGAVLSVLAGAECAPSEGGYDDGGHAAVGPVSSAVLAARARHSEYWSIPDRT